MFKNIYIKCLSELMYTLFSILPKIQNILPSLLSFIFLHFILNCIGILKRQKLVVNSSAIVAEYEIYCNLSSVRFVCPGRSIEISTSIIFCFLSFTVCTSLSGKYIFCDELNRIFFYFYH